MIVDDKKLSEWTKNINYSLNIEKKTNDNFIKYYSYVFDKCLTDADITALKSKNKNTFDFSTLRPFIMHALKGMQDAMPTVSFKSIEKADDDYPEIPGEIIADQLSLKLEEILKYSYFDNIVYSISRDQCVGGKGIFKIYTDYLNNYNFQQTFFISHIKDVSKIFFDPLCKNLIKDDARWVAEKIGMPEKSFKKEFSQVNIDELDNFSVGNFNWVENVKNTEEKIINIIDYYYKVEKNKIIYLNNEGDITNDSDNQVNKRIVKESKIWRVRFCGNNILEKAVKTVFTHIPFIYVPGESYVDKNGEIEISPYAKHGFDCMRSKNFILNYYMSDVLNNPKTTFKVDENSLVKGTMDALRNSQDGDVQIYKSSLKDITSGANEATAGITLVPSPQLPNELLQASSEIGNDLNSIFGTQFPSLNDLNNVSGKALYNLSQYMSASTEVLMQNLLQGIVQVGNLIKEGMPEILQEESINFLDKNTGETKEIMFDYIYNPSKYRIIGQRGVSTRLQKEANLESLIGMAQSIPQFAPFLGSPEVMKKMLQIMELDNEEQWLKLWDQYQQIQASQANEANSQEQLAQENMQINQARVSALNINANAHMMDAQTRAKEMPYNQQQNNLTQQVNAAKVVESRRKTDLNSRIETAKLNQKHIIDLLNNASKTRG